MPVPNQPEEPKLHLIAAIEYDSHNTGWLICLCGWDGDLNDWTAHLSDSRKKGVITLPVVKNKMTVSPYGRSHEIKEKELIG